jgi:hypothetical protein
VVWSDLSYLGFQARHFFDGQWQTIKQFSEPGSGILGAKILSRDSAFILYTNSSGNQKQVLVREYKGGVWLDPKVLMADSMITGGLVGQTASGKVFLCVRSLTSGSSTTTLNAFVAL